MRQDNRHTTGILEVVDTVLHEREISFRLRCKLAEVFKTRVFQLGLGVVPMLGIRRISDYSIKRPRMVNTILVDTIRPILFQCIRITQLHVLVVNAVHHEIHSCQVVGCTVQFLAMESDPPLTLRTRQFLLHSQQQRARAAGWVIHAEILVDIKNDLRTFGRWIRVGHQFGQYTGHFVRRIEFTRLLTGIAGELRNKILVDIAENIVSGFILEVDGVHLLRQVGQTLGTSRRGVAQRGISEIDVGEHFSEIFLCSGVQLGVLPERIEHRLKIVGAKRLVTNPGYQRRPCVFRINDVSKALRDVLAPSLNTIQLCLTSICVIKRLTLIGLDDILVPQILQIHLLSFGQITIENESEDVIAKLVSGHLAAQIVRHRPQLRCELLCRVLFCHGIILSQ